MKLHLQSDSGVTLIENAFIDQYMPAANGEFVKLYLYLLRCAGAGLELSISSIADFFDHTEKDVRRALAYWEKLDVIRLRYDEKGNISDIVFCSDAEPAEAGQSGQISAAAGDRVISFSRSQSREDFTPDTETETEAEEEVPPKSSLSTARRRALKEQEDIRQLVFVTETYLGRTLTAMEQTNLMYFYDTLHFSTDLIEYLVEYCATKGNPGPRYMEKVAQGWYKDGITTVAEAKRHSNLYNKEYYQIFEALGMKGRTPAPREIEYMQRWLKEWGFSMSVIQEACARTVMQTQKPSLSYADGILKSWYQAGVHTRTDIRSLDRVHAARKQTAAPTRTSAPAGRSRFNNFPQRNYNYDELEQELYAAQFGKGE